MYFQIKHTLKNNHYYIIKHDFILILFFTFFFFIYVHIETPSNLVDLNNK